MLRWKIFRSRWTALIWFLTMNILFFLPGEAFPQENWLSAIYFDKWVHIGLFAVLLFLWRSAFDLAVANYTAWIFLAAVLYGFLVEIIQREWVANRSFDLYDLMADTAGITLGLLIWLWTYRKK